MATVFVGIGSNIKPEDNLRAAAAMLQGRFGNVCFSSVYRTAPQGHEEQAEFLNAVAALETEEKLESITAALREIEMKLGKAVPFRFGPRTIDLDLLMYEDVVLPNVEEWRDGRRKTEDGRLLVPHPRMHERRFVLEPLCELLDPRGRHPALGKTWEELLRGVEDQGSQKTAITLAKT